MTLVRIQSETENPEWPYGGDTATLRIFASQSFYSNPEGVQVTGGAPGSQSWAYEFECEIVDDHVVIPIVELYATLEAQPSTSKYTAIFYDEQGRRRNTKLNQFYLSPYSIDMSAEASVEVTVAGTTAARGIYTYRGQDNGKGYYNLDTFADSTSNRVIVWTGSQWRINSSLGARLYYSAEDVDFPWDVVTWTADVGIAPVPSVVEYAETITTTWSDIANANQAYVPNYNIVNTTWSPAQIQQYVSTLVGNGTTPFSSTLRCGKTFLTADPDPSTDPIAVAENDPYWTTFTSEVRWLTPEFDNDFSAAVTAIGATPATLVITETTDTVSSNTTVPSTLRLMFMSGGLLTVQSGRTVTIGAMDPSPTWQIFSGSGSVVFAKNATGGEFNLSWWAGITNSGDLTTKFAQIGTSLTTNTGGIVKIGPGVWKVQEFDIPDNTTIQGSGNGVNATNATVLILPGDIDSPVLTVTEAFRNVVVKDLTIAVTNGTNGFIATGTAPNSGINLKFENVTFYSSQSSAPAQFYCEDLGGAWECVDVVFDHCSFLVPTSGIGFHCTTINTTFTFNQCLWSLGAGATGIKGGAGIGWVNIIAPDVRGPGSFVSTATLNRAITGSTGASVLTLSTGAFTLNDVGQKFTVGAVTGNILGLLTDTTATIDTASASADTTCNIYRYTPSTSMAYAFIHVEGDRAVINVYGSADEGIRYFLVNDADTNRSPINVFGGFIQSTVLLNGACVMNLYGTAMFSQTFTDDTGVTSNLFTHGCSIDKTTVNLTTGGLATIELTTPRMWGVMNGAMIFATDLNFHEGGVYQNINARQSFLQGFEYAASGYDTSNALVTMASAHEGATDKPLLRIGRQNDVTNVVDLYYDFARRNTSDPADLRAGWMIVTGNQEDRYRGYSFDAMVETLKTFVGPTYDTATITSNQDNYNLATNHETFVNWVTDASRNITGIAYTFPPNTPGELHYDRNDGAQNVVFRHQDTNSLAANRIYSVTGGDIVLRPGEVAFRFYSEKIERWVMAKFNITGLTSNGTTVTSSLPFTSTGAFTASSTAAITGATTIGAGQAFDFSMTPSNTNVGVIDIGSTANHINLDEGGGVSTGVLDLTADSIELTGPTTINGSTPLVATDLLRSYLANIFTVNNSASMTNTAISVTLEATTKYQIELTVFSTSTVRAIAMDFGGTATFTNYIGSWSGTDATDYAVGGQAYVTAAGTDFSEATLDAVASQIYTFRGSCLTNGAGTFILRGAQRSADASNTSILVGSTLVLTKIS